MLFVLKPSEENLERLHGKCLKIKSEDTHPNHKALMAHATESCNFAIQSGWLENYPERIEEFESFVELSEEYQSSRQSLSSCCSYGQKNKKYLFIIYKNIKYS